MRHAHCLSAICVLLLAALILSACQPIQAPEAGTPVPAQEPALYWPASTPEEQGFDSAALAKALLTIRESNIPIHSLLWIRNGKVVVDAYFYPYDGNTVHDLASATKSVMTTLIAIAAAQGKLDLDQPLVSFFPDRTIANRDAPKESITVRDLAKMASGLAMASGLDTLGFAQDEGSLEEMQASPDQVQFALDRKVVAEPGTRFVYDSLGMHLLSAILQQATGQTALEFAQENLFGPLGITLGRWASRTSSGPAIPRESPTAGAICICFLGMRRSSASCGSTTECGMASRSFPPNGSRSRSRCRSKFPASPMATVTDGG